MDWSRRFALTFLLDRSRKLTLHGDSDGWLRKQVELALVTFLFHEPDMRARNLDACRTVIRKRPLVDQPKAEVIQSSIKLAEIG